jgi:hypothetical protein
VCRPHQPLYHAGNRIEQLLFFVPRPVSLGLMISLLSDNGTARWRMRLIHWMALIGIFGLAGCGLNGSQPTPTPLPRPTATSAVTPTAPPATALLPAPLYLNENGVLFRVAQDAQQRDLIAGAPNGAGGVSEFDVAPNGALAFLEARPGQARTTGALVRVNADGTAAQTLLTGDYFTGLRWSPDATQLALGVMELIGGPPPTLDPGVYLVPADGGPPRFVLASERHRPEIQARVYVPQGWSPDGSRLLLNVYGLENGVCGLAVLALHGGPFVVINPPLGLTIACDQAVWRADSGAIVLNMYRIGSGILEPGLWQADPTSGLVTEFVPPQGPAGWNMVSIGVATPDGGWLALVTVTHEPPTEAMVLEWQPARIGADGSITPLNIAPYPLDWWVAAWAPDGSGVVVQQTTGMDATTLLWLPDGGDPVPFFPGQRASRLRLAWGS